MDDELGLFQLSLIVPWEPEFGCLDYFSLVFPQSYQVFIETNFHSFTGGNQREHSIPNFRSFKEVGHLSNPDGSFQGLLAVTVRDWDTRFSQKQSQFRIVIKEVLHSSGKMTVGFDPLFIEYARTPLIETLHYQGAIFLVQPESLDIIQVISFGLIVGFIDQFPFIQYILAAPREGFPNFKKIPYRMIIILCSR